MPHDVWVCIGYEDHPTLFTVPERLEPGSFDYHLVLSAKHSEESPLPNQEDRTSKGLESNIENLPRGIQGV